MGEWYPWKFGKVRANFWNSIDNQRQYTDWLMKELNLTTLSDWYGVVATDLFSRHGSSFHSEFRGIVSPFLNVCHDIYLVREETDGFVWAIPAGVAAGSVSATSMARLAL
jgi:hypothetical protein